MELELAEKSDCKAIKKIYVEAFPAEERAPFRLIKRRMKNGGAEMLAAKNGETLIGMAYVVCENDVVYLFYLAVEKSERGRGGGTEMLNLIKARYAGKRLFLAREQLDKTADNYEMRVRRRGFYMRNGFIDIPRTIKEGSVVFDVMSVDGAIVEPEEYMSLMTKWGGRKISKLVGMSCADLK